MLRSTAFLRYSTHFAILPSFLALAAACSDSGSSAKGNDAGLGGDAPSGDAAIASDAPNEASGDDGASNGGDDGSAAADDTGSQEGGALADTGIVSDTSTATPMGPAPVLLGAAGKYVVLGMSAIANTPISKVTGDIGLSPAAGSYITGFSLTRAGTKWTSAQVVGGIFSADNDPPTPIDLTTAVASMQTAYTDAAGRPTPQFMNLGSGAIGGLTLAPGLYKWTSAVTIPSDVMISGAPNDVWIFQITGDLTMSASKAMTLSGGARAKNIFWQVAGLVDFGTMSHAEGIVLSKTQIKVATGGSINGRLLAQTSVTIAGATITAPAP